MKRPATLLDKPVLFQNPDYGDTTVTLDIETAPSIGAFFDFYKEQNIVWTEKQWFIMMMSWKVLGKPKVSHASIWDFKEWDKSFCLKCGQMENIEEAEKKLLLELREVLDKALLVIGQNVRRFDIKKLNAKFIKYDIDPPSPYRTIDTMVEHKAIAATNTNKLGDLVEFYDLRRKIVTEKDLHRKCLQNDKKSQRDMEVYCDGDVLATEALYLKERGWYKHHPNMSVLLENMTVENGKLMNCRKCGSDHLQKAGFEYGNNNTYQSYRCMNCGARPNGEKIDRPKPFFK